MSNPTTTRLSDPDDVAEPELQRLLTSPAERQPAVARRIDGAVIGSLIGFDPGGAIPLVVYPGQPESAALRAQTIVDLHADHVGSDVVLQFDQGDPNRPIVMGVLRNQRPAGLPGASTHVEIDADGERLIVTAKEQIALRCGKASIILTKDGKVLLQGTYVSTRSSGVLRLKGGSVQIN